jgi:microcin C transport system permease protein
MNPAVNPTVKTTSPAQVSPTVRAWQRFKRNRLGFGSLVVFLALFVLSLGAEFWSNDKPLVVRFQGQWYFPVVQTLPEKLFGGDFETPADYLDPFIQQQLHTDGNWALQALNPYHHSTLDYFAPLPNPAPPNARNVLGTDDRGRDVLARLIYGFRVSVLFALALTLFGVVLGVLTGAIQGFFVEKPTWSFSASSRFGVPCPSCIC